MSVRTDWKTPARVIEDTLGWEQLRRAKLGPCRVCGETWLPSLHHLVSRSLGGDDVPANMVPLCGHGTKGCHGLIESHDPVACKTLGDRLSMSEVRYVVGKKGAAYLTRRYGLDAA